MYKRDHNGINAIQAKTSVKINENIMNTNPTNNLEKYKYKKAHHQKGRFSC